MVPTISAMVQNTPTTAMLSEHTSTHEAPLPPDTRAPKLKSVITGHAGDVTEVESFMSPENLVLPPRGKVPEFVTSTPGPEMQELLLENDGSRGGLQPGLQEQNSALSVTEQEILASIQELQRQLWEHKNKEDPREIPTKVEIKDGEVEGGPVEKSRVVVVSNRLPISASRDLKTGEWHFKMSSGGLVTALQGVRHEMDFLWIGWMGVDVQESEREHVSKRLAEEYSCVPVYIEHDLMDKFYNGFSNDVLWPLFHYVPLPMYKAGNEKKFDNGLWEAYKQANQRFAKVISSVYNDGDHVWVHDYHLMQVPAELRKLHPNCRVAWFLHTPFPSSEIYRILPVRKPLLQGLLAADLVGFHTYDYARHFLSACSRVLEVECSPRGIEYKNRFMSLGVFPIGIDPDHVAKTLRKPWVRNRIEELSETFAGRKILLGVDRLDYIKGMPHKLLGLELFLNRYPEWRGKVTLIQVGVPSRTEVAEYRDLGAQVNELVGRINGNHGTLEYSPVHYINQSISQDELFAIYNVADVCLVTSVRDGMNLVSHEYVAAQSEPRQPVVAGAPVLERSDGPGVLILSEFAGSAQSLSGAIRVNPWNTEELANAMHQALTLSRVERELRQHKLYRYVTVHTASFWAKSFMQEFREVCDGQRESTRKLPTLPVKEVLAAYKNARNRLIISDYDGTLTTLQSLPQLASPPPVVTTLLDSLCRDPKNRLFIISGRERRFMDTWLGKLRAGLAAEYGFYYRLPEAEQWQCIGQDLDLSWKDVVRPIMQYFTERTPGTYIENKESSLTWHYRDADPHFGLWQAKDMQIQMEDVLSNLPLEILQGNRMVEVRHQAANKSMVAEAVLKLLSTAQSVRERGEVDFILCAGDDRSDEDMFQTVKRFRDHARDSPTPVFSPTSDDEELHFPDESQDQIADMDPMGMSQNSLPVSQQTATGMAMVGQARKMTRNAAVYTVHIGLEHSHADFYLDTLKDLRVLLRQFDQISTKERTAAGGGISPKDEPAPRRSSAGGLPHEGSPGITRDPIRRQGRGELGEEGDGDERDVRARSDRQPSSFGQSASRRNTAPSVGE